MGTDDAITMGESGHHKRVRIHIDQKPYESPNPTTGAALYRLGNVKPGLKLYREVKGDREDAVVDDGPEAIHLKEDEHFHSGEPKSITIIVEGTPHEWTKASITYAEVVTLFDPTYPQHPETTYSVKYKRGPAHKPEGILSPGASVKVKDKMVFNVSSTGQS
ncbi:MAG TPA: multiubiquitin domain-containing protein [Tepidisphaeraceae bacterium]|nr:multiubiquitin domain-containing protein [Tepidisphaeraceae bacterium]